MAIFSSGRKHIAICLGLSFALFVAVCGDLRAAEVNPGEGLSIEFREKYVYLQGHIRAGDGARFIKKMRSANVQCPLVRLNSGGGAGVEAVEIGTYIRQHGMTTWTDGVEDQCASACNRIFAGGLNRVYSNAQMISTGKREKVKGEKLHGLGFHHPNQGGDFQAAASHYHKNIVPYLRSMLAREAFDWVYETDKSNLTFNMVWLNGDQALALGIATTDQVPPECVP